MMYYLIDVLPNVFICNSNLEKLINSCSKNLRSNLGYAQVNQGIYKAKSVLVTDINKSFLSSKLSKNRLKF